MKKHKLLILGVIGFAILGVLVFIYAPALQEMRKINQLRFMIQSGNALGVSKLIQSDSRLLKADLGSRRNDKLRALSSASGHGNVIICSNLIVYGADVNERDRYHYTPLHYAVMAEQPKVAIFLIQQGADLTLKDFQGMTPLDLAIKFNASSNLIEILTNGTSLYRRSAK